MPVDQSFSSVLVSANGAGAFKPHFPKRDESFFAIAPFHFKMKGVGVREALQSRHILPVTEKIYSAKLKM
jgi:hypothetical protein